MAKPQYANHFTFLTSQETGETVIGFYNSWPEIDEKGDVLSQKEELVKIVMTYPHAKKLMEAISQSLKPYEESLKGEG